MIQYQWWRVQTLNLAKHYVSNNEGPEEGSFAPGAGGGGIPSKVYALSVATRPFGVRCK